MVGAAADAAGAGETELAGAVLGQRAGAGHGAGVDAVEVLVEDHRGVVRDGALQALARALQGPGRDRGAGAVAVVAAQDQLAGAGLGQAADAGDGAGKAAVRGLVERDRSGDRVLRVGIEGDVAAAQGRGVALQRAAVLVDGPDCAAGARQDERAGADLGEAASCGHLEDPRSG